MNPQKIDLTEMRLHIIKLAKEAGKIARKYFQGSGYSIKSKGGMDIVTQADLEIDKFLLTHLNEKYPHIPCLTEETAPADYTSLSEAESLFVIDPLDGTINYSRGFSNFAISVAFVSKGKSLVGVAYLPITDDLYWAQEDSKNAFHNERPIQISTIDALKEGILVTDWSHDIEARKITARQIQTLIPQTRQIRIEGCAVTGIINVASGKIDGYFHSKLKPWDSAAAVLIVNKAGGKITNLTGDPYNFFKPGLVVTNALIHDELLKILNH